MEGRGEDFVVVHHDKEAATHDFEREYAVVNIRQVINCLQKTGYVDKGKIEQLNTSLPGYMNADTLGRNLSKGDKLIFDYNTIEVLAGEKLLKACIKVFEVYIDDRYVSDSKAEIATGEYRDSIRHEVSQIREYIADKIKTARYKHFTHSNMGEAGAQENDARHETEACLADLLGADTDEATLVWSDDRFVNRYTGVNDTPIIDTYDILNLLHSEEIIGESRFYSAITLLRQANYCYLPVTTNEVIFHLKTSGSDISQDAETESLRTVRQYVAMTVIQEDFLQFDVNHDQAIDEKKFLFDTVMLANKCILSIWSDTTISIETKKKYSAWVWDSLRIDRVKRLPVRQPTEEGYKYLYVVTLAGLLMNAMQIPENNDDFEAQYLEWLEDYALAPIFDANKGLVDKVSKNIQQLLMEMLKDVDTKDPSDQSGRAIVIYAGEFVKKLPVKVQEAILKNRALSERLMVRNISIVGIKGKNFNARNFWRGLGKALKEGHASIKTQDRKDSIDIHLAHTDNNIPVFTVGKDGKETLSDALFAFLSPVRADVIKAFEINREWFEYPAKERKRIESTIVNAKDMARRINIIESERKGAPAYKYAKLEDHIRNQSSFEWDSLSPAPINRLINHLRLRISQSADIQARVATAADRIIAEEGPQVAFRMFSGLPFYLPEVIVKAFQDMGKEELKSALEGIYRQCQSPLRLFHYLYLVRTIDKDVKSHEQFKHALGRLQDFGIKLCEAHAAVLRYFDKELCAKSEWYNVIVPERAMVAWYHSDQIINLLLSYGMPVDEITTIFSERHIPATNYSLLRDKDYRICPYAPANVHASKLLFAGLQMAVGESCEKNLSEPQRTAFKELFVVRQEDQIFIDPWLLHDTSTYPSPLKSFLTESNYKFSVSLGGEEFAEQLKTEIMAELVQGTIEKM